MTSFDDALRIILESAQPLGSENVKLAKCNRGRVLATDIVASTPLPRFPNSSKDGYAVCSTDLLSAGPGRPIELQAVGESTAGNPFKGRVESGQTVLTTTGARLPHGADAIVKQEDVQSPTGDHIVFSHTVPHGNYVRHVGDDIREGERVLAAGDTLHAPEIGILASLGIRRVNVCKRPVVNILATGDELVEPGKEPEDGQIHSSSSHLLAAMVEQVGARPRICGIAPDKRKKIRKLVADSLDCDILLLTGGTSNGKHDFVGEVLEELGIALKVRGVQIRPGRPMLFGSKGNTLIFGLPGSPLSTYVTFLEFVRPALNKMLGKSRYSGLRVTASTDDPLEKRDDRRDFLLGDLTWDGARWHVRRTDGGESQALSLMVKSNCLITLPEDCRGVGVGDLVSVELLPGRLLPPINTDVFRIDH